MQGNSVSTASWLGGAIILASLVAIFGIHWYLSHNRAQVREAQEAERSSQDPLTDDSTIDEPPLPAKDPEANRRVKELLNQSEESGPPNADWERIWFIDPRSKGNPDRIEGAIQ